MALSTACEKGVPVVEHEKAPLVLKRSDNGQFRKYTSDSAHGLLQNEKKKRELQKMGKIKDSGDC